MAKPVLVFIHGAFFAASCWDSVRSSFEKHSYETLAFSLPSVSIGSTVTSHYEDTAVIRETLLQLIEGKNRDVVLVMHSYGGVPGSEAVEGLEKSRRGKTKGGVIHCVYIAAYLVPVGVSILDLLAGGLPDAVIRDVCILHPSNLPFFSLLGLWHPHVAFLLTIHMM